MSEPNEESFWEIIAIFLSIAIPVFIVAAIYFGALTTIFPELSREYLSTVSLVLAISTFFSLYNLARLGVRA